jgi:hypothetical protein
VPYHPVGVPGNGVRPKRTERQGRFNARGAATLLDAYTCTYLTVTICLTLYTLWCGNLARARWRFRVSMSVSFLFQLLKSRGLAILSSREQVPYRICVASLDLSVVVAVALIISADFASLKSRDCLRVNSSLFYVCSRAGGISKTTLLSLTSFVFETRLFRSPFLEDIFGL